MKSELDENLARFLKGELKRRGVSYRALALALQQVGMVETRETVANKISRGKFSASFFISCLRVAGCERVEISKL